MAARAEPLLVTVAQYRELPRREDVIQELHWHLCLPNGARDSNHFIRQWNQCFGHFRLKYLIHR